ncbi:uncharacterized protein lmod1b [Stigmatopora argus]
MSRRKVRGLTRMGRQVSEDPDLDTLLSTLSPEEMEELEKDMMKVPDVNPEDAQLVGQGDNNRRDDKSFRANDAVRIESKKEIRKQESPKKTSQEGKDAAGVQRGGGNPFRDGGRKAESSKEEPIQPPAVPEDGFEGKTAGDLGGTTDRRESRESKTRDVISKLQEKKKEDVRRDDCRRRDDTKTKDIISRLREKSEKSEKEIGKERLRRSDSFRTQGLVSRMLEKQQSRSQESGEDKNPRCEDKNPRCEDKNPRCEDKNPRCEDKNPRCEDKNPRCEDKNPRCEDKNPRCEDKNPRCEDKNPRCEDKKKTARGLERQASEKENTTRREELLNHGDRVAEKKAEEEKFDKREEVVNCLAPSGKTKTEEGEDDPDSGMFDELLEQVRSDDPALAELNVNNSEAIKTKTLMELAEALQCNTCVKKVALANCRADDHVAYALAGTLRRNSTVTSINLDSNLLTGKGILALIQALRYNSTLTELRFHNQRHVCGGKTEMEMTKVLKENTTLLKLGYHFELAGPRMTTTNILSRNMDRQRQKRLQEQKQARAGNGSDNKDALEVPKPDGGASQRNSSTWNSPMASPKPSPMPSPLPSPSLSPKRGVGPSNPPPPPPPPPGGGPPPPPPPLMLEVDSLRNSLSPVSRRSVDGKGRGGTKNSRDQLLASIRGSNAQQLKKVPVPKWLQ